MTRFQLVFRRKGLRDQTETRDDGQAEPRIDGKLIVEGDTYVIRGVEWIIHSDLRVEGDGMRRFICTLAAEPAHKPEPSTA